MKTFHAVLANSLVAFVANNFVWFAVTFWVYLETKSVIATSVMAGVFTLTIAFSGFFLGSLVDRYPKKRVIQLSSILSLVLYALASLIFFTTPYEEFADASSVRLWIFIVLAIKLDSRGPIFYRQERVGMDGRIFLVYKFRTMRTDSDSEIHREYQKKFIAGKADANVGDDTKPAYKLRDDPRITRAGRVLRRFSLDEAPQLFNVLRGDMSVVGPRPPIPYEVEAYELWHRKRLDMKPGVTGLWQVSGRNRLSFEEMVKLDLFYIENWSLLFDMKIILRTVLVLVRGEGY